MVIQPTLRKCPSEEGRRTRRWESHRAQCKMPWSMYSPQEYTALQLKEHCKVPHKTQLRSLVLSHPVGSPQKQLLPNLWAVSSDVYLHIYKHMLLLIFLDFSTFDISYWLPTIRRLGFSFLLPLLKAEWALVNRKLRDISKKEGSCYLAGYCQKMQPNIGRMCQSMFICK